MEVKRERNRRVGKVTDSILRHVGLVASVENPGGSIW